MQYRSVLMAAVLVALATPGTAGAITKTDAIRAAELDNALLVSQNPEINVTRTAVIGCRKLRYRPEYRCIIEITGYGSNGIVEADQPDAVGRWSFTDHRLMSGRSCRRVRVEDVNLYEDPARTFNTCPRLPRLTAARHPRH